MAKEEPTFEQSIARLEKLVESIEQGKIGLEESIKHFEEGMGLIQRCRKILSRAELKIQRLQVSGANDALVAEDVDSLGDVGDS